jgi:hypothetical protein
MRTRLAFLSLSLLITLTVASDPAYPRMSASVRHDGVVVFGPLDDADGFAAAKQKALAFATLLKKTAIGSEFSPTASSGGSKISQLSVQLEFGLDQFSNLGEATFNQRVDEMITLWLDQGFAVHLLLPLHYRPKKTFSGITPTEAWSTAQYMPYKPTPNGGSRYDTISTDFQVHVIKHLAGNGLASRLSVIYIANEFDFNDTNGASYSDALWPNCDKQCRKQAVAYTTNRVLGNARAAAAGKVPVGVKLSALIGNSAYVDPYTQLPWLLNSVMLPNTDVLGADIYFSSTNAYDVPTRNALAKYLPAFANGGRFELTEWGRLCSGDTPVGAAGRTTAADAKGIMSYASGAWPEANGYQLFGFNPGNCYRIYNSTTGWTDGGQAELRNVLRAQVVNDAGAVTVLNEGGENKAPGWSLAGATIEASPYSKSGGYRFRCAANASCTMTSPALDLTGYTTIFLACAYKHDLPAGTSLIVDAVSGSTVVTLATKSGRSYGYDNWAADTYSLNGMAGKQNVVIRFRYTGKVSTLFGITTSN